MDFPNTDPGRGNGAPGLPRAAAAALADPIVQALMAADRVDAGEIQGLLRRTAARLAGHDPAIATRHGPAAGLATLCKAFFSFSR